MSQPSSARANRRVVCLMVALMGAVFALGGGFFAISLPARQQRAEVDMTSHSRGRVTSFEEVRDQDSVTWRAVISFTPPSGPPVQFRTTFSSNKLQEQWPVGTDVDVAYDPHTPTHAAAPQVETQGLSFLRIFGDVFLVGGLFMVVVGLSVLLRT